jgi:hypothetical protein
MKFKKILLLPALLFSICCKGQSDSLSQKPSRFNIFISAGAGIPVGKFSRFEKIPSTNSEQNFNMSGAAQTGISASAGCRYLFGKHLGAAASFYYSTFSAEKLSGSEIFDHADLPGYNWQWDRGAVSEIGNWQVMGLLIGVSYEGSIGKVGYGVNLKGGIQRSGSPEAVLITTDSVINIFTGEPDEIIRKQQAMKSNAFAYHAGGFVSYKIGRKTALSLMADYTSASHHFKDGTLEYELHTDYSLAPWTFKTNNPISFKKQISFVNVMLGFVLNI